jgi:hypothetical protein
MPSLETLHDPPIGLNEAMRYLQHKLSSLTRERGRETRAECE